MLPVLDLWRGTGSATVAWDEHGHSIIGVDNNPRWPVSMCRDIITVTSDELTAHAPDGYAFGWASPDCSVFTLANLHSGHFQESIHPQTDKAREMILRVKHTLHLLETLDSPYWVLENPWGLLRLQPFMQRYQSCEVTYCQYGDDRMKRTNLWGRFPESFNPKRCDYGDSCHPRTPRGSYYGTQGLPPAKRAQIPYALSSALYHAAIESEGRSWSTLDDYFSL